MTNEAIIAAAVRLNIKPTRAPVGSQIWECWRDRVLHALIIENELSEYRWDEKENSCLKPFLDKAISEASAYAV